MKKTVYHSKSIRNRILLFTLSAILGMCLLISLFSYYIFRHYLQNTLIQPTESMSIFFSISPRRLSMKLTAISGHWAIWV